MNRLNPRDPAIFRHEPDPDNPGWMTWEVLDQRLFNPIMGKFLVRREDGNHARCRITPGDRMANLAGNVHGGALMGFIDVAMFAGTKVMGLDDALFAVTLDCNVQFLSPGRLGIPLEAAVELMRETRRLAFVRGLIEQEGETVAAFSGTFRKASAGK